MWLHRYLLLADDEFWSRSGTGGDTDRLGAGGVPSPSERHKDCHVTKKETAFCGGVNGGSDEGKSGLWTEKARNREAEGLTRPVFGRVKFA